MKKQKALYTYNFTGGGYNQTYAHNIRQAIKQAKEEFPTMDISEKSFKRLVSQKEQDDYYKMLRMMFD